jgi:hypothetical protein
MPSFCSGDPKFDSQEGGDTEVALGNFRFGEQSEERPLNFIKESIIL